jgi:hypothetical protein
MFWLDRHRVVLFVRLPTDCPHTIFPTLPKPENATGIAALKNVQNIAARNRYIHSIGALDHPDANGKRPIILIRREIRDGYKVSIAPFKMEAHMRNVMQAVDKVQAHFGISNADVEAYSHSIAGINKDP